MKQAEADTFYPASRQAWRQWLQQNHRSKSSVWLIHYKKASGHPTISWSEAVDEALCFGWIDSIRKTIDEEKFIQFFGKRKPRSGWSKINKEKVERLIDEGLMTEPGYQSIETAKQNGSWIILDDVEALAIPADLKAAFSTQKGSEDFFLSLSKSVRKAMLQWLILAKRPQTRRARISEIATLAAQKLKPGQFR